MVSFNIPLPPSTNSLFANVTGVGRVKTKRYKEWIVAAGWEIKRQNVPKVSGPVSISLQMERPNKSSDLDNRCKGILDLLVSMDKIDDDRNVQSISAAWSPDVKGCLCTVTGVEQ